MTTIYNPSTRDWKCPSISEVDAAKNQSDPKNAAPRNWTVPREKFPWWGRISPPGSREGCAAGAAYFAATPAISTKYLGAASRASTVARAGGFAGSIQASHTEFMSSK
jgi:hypothetical protein